MIFKNPKCLYNSTMYVESLIYGSVDRMKFRKLLILRGGLHLFQIITTVIPINFNNLRCNPIRSVVCNPTVTCRVACLNIDFICSSLIQLSILLVISFRQSLLQELTSRYFNFNVGHSFDIKHSCTCGRTNIIPSIIFSCISNN